MRSDVIKGLTLSVTDQVECWWHGFCVQFGPNVQLKIS